MVKASNDWEFNNITGFHCSHGTTVWRIALQGLICSPWMAVAQIRRQKSFEMPLVAHDDVIEKFSA